MMVAVLSSDSVIVVVTTANDRQPVTSYSCLIVIVALLPGFRDTDDVSFSSWRTFWPFLVHLRRTTLYKFAVD